MRRLPGYAGGTGDLLPCRTVVAEAYQHRDRIHACCKADPQLQQLPRSLTLHRYSGALLCVPFDAARDRWVAQQCVRLHARFADGRNLYRGAGRRHVGCESKFDPVVHVVRKHLTRISLNSFVAASWERPHSFTRHSRWSYGLYGVIALLLAGIALIMDAVDGMGPMRLSRVATPGVAVVGSTGAAPSPVRRISRSACATDQDLTLQPLEG